jgi:hypothetical protein
MSVVPKQYAARIQFFQEHVSPWTTNATAIGTTVTDVTALESKVEAARLALDAQSASQEVAKAATEAVKQAIDAMTNAGNAIIEQVRTKSRSAGPAVFPLAQIPAPVTPSPIGAPGLPNSLKAELFPNGTLDLTWKCTNPQGCTGVIYQIYRKIESTGDYHYLGGSGDKTWTDNTLPAGVPSVTYQIQGTRSTAIGVAAEFTVNFGVSSGSGVSVVASTAKAQPQPARIAA